MSGSLSAMAIAALGLLADRPRHPYEMYQLLLDREEDRVLKVRPGTLYHTVDRLARDGLVRPVCTEREGNRPERTTFAITTDGRAALTRRIAEMLAVPPKEYPQFPLAISEAHNLPIDEVADCLRTRLRALRAAQRDVDERLRSRGAERIPRRFRLDIDFDRAVRDAEIRWVQAVLDDLESGILPWPDPAALLDAKADL